MFTTLGQYLAQLSCDLLLQLPDFFQQADIDFILVDRNLKVSRAKRLLPLHQQSGPATRNVLHLWIGGPLAQHLMQRIREIQLRHDRHRTDTAAVVIYHKGQRMGAARLLDAVANGLLRRKELP